MNMNGFFFFFYTIGQNDEKQKMSRVTFGHWK